LGSGERDQGVKYQRRGMQGLKCLSAFGFWGTMG